MILDRRQAPPPAPLVGADVSDLDDPEDAYDATDPVPARLTNLDHRLGWIADQPRPRHRPDTSTCSAISAGSALDDLATIARELFP